MRKDFWQCTDCGKKIPEDKLFIIYNKLTGKDSILCDDCYGLTKEKWILEVEQALTFGEYQVMLNNLGSVLKNDSKKAKAWLYTAQLLEIFGYFSEALNCYQKSLKIQPSNKGSKQGINRITHLTERKKQVTMWSTRGISLHNAGRLADARVCYQKAIQLDATDTETWINMGILNYDLLKPEEAIKCYDKALSIDPNSANAWGAKGVAFGSSQEGLECLNKALEIDPTLIHVQYNKAGSLRELGMFNEAIELYNKVLERNPDHHSASIGRMMAQRGEKGFKSYGRSPGALIALERTEQASEILYSQEKPLQLPQLFSLEKTPSKREKTSHKTMSCSFCNGSGRCPICVGTGINLGMACLDCIGTGLCKHCKD